MVRTGLVTASGCGGQGGGALGPGLPGSRGAGSSWACPAWPRGHAEDGPFEAAKQGVPRPQAPWWFSQVYTSGAGFEGGQEGLMGLHGETPVASGASHHLGYKDHLVGLLHVPPELQHG